MDAVLNHPTMDLSSLLLQRTRVPHKVTRFLPHRHSPALPLWFFTTLLLSFPPWSSTPLSAVRQASEALAFKPAAGCLTHRSQNLTARPWVLAGRHLVLKHDFIPRKHLPLSNTCHAASRQ